MIEDTVAGFDGVCSKCGFVIHDSTDTTVPDWLGVGEADEENDDEEWMNVCRVRNATEQQLAQAFDKIEEIGDWTTVSVSLRGDAADIYCSAFLAGTTDGRDTATMTAACVRFASLQAENPVPAGRLSEMPEVDKQQFHLSYSALCDDLDRTPPTPQPTDYLPFLVKALSLNDKRMEASDRMLQSVTGNPSLVGKDPAGIAAAAFYLTEEEITQREVAEAAGVSTETVRQRVAQLRELVNND